MKITLCGKETKSRGRGTQKVKAFPHKAHKEGNTRFQPSPCGGEDTTPKGVNISPPLHVGYGGRRGTGLRLPGPVSLPPPRNLGRREEKKKFSTLER